MPIKTFRTNDLSNFFSVEMYRMDIETAFDLCQEKFRQTDRERETQRLTEIETEGKILTGYNNMLRKKHVLVWVV